MPGRALRWDEIPQLMQLVYSTTGFHALVSHTLEVFKMVLACQERWAASRSWFQWTKGKNRHRRYSQVPADLPAIVAALEQRVSEGIPLDNEVRRTLNAAFCFVNETW